jgi:hypothetical protein
MTPTKRTAWCALWLLILIPVIAGAAPDAATVRTCKKVIRTDPFSDPNPIPVVDRISPYFRFDGYTDTPVDKEWTVVELENDDLRVAVFPEKGRKDLERGREVDRAVVQPGCNSPRWRCGGRRSARPRSQRGPALQPRRSRGEWAAGGLFESGHGWHCCPGRP